MSLWVDAPDGQRWWLQASDEAGTLEATRFPREGIMAQAYGSPVQLSKTARKAFEWTVTTAGVYALLEVEVARGLFHYLPLVTPQGAQKVILLTDAGVLQIAELDAAGRIEKPLVVVRHNKVYAVDRRYPPPPLTRTGRQTY